jgi:hypothetical protein
MAHKQVNALATLSGIAADDLIPIFDSSEAGDEKLKKYTVQELKSDLTSMDPSAFGNWVLIREDIETGNPILIGTSTGSLVFEQDKVYKAVISIETDGTNTSENFTFNSYFNGDWQNSSRYIANNNSGINGAVLQDNIYKECKLKAEIFIYPAAKMIRSVLTIVDNNNTLDNRTVLQYYNHTDTVTGWLWNLWGTGGKYGSGSTKWYVWQEIKPIELHSYELVKEYNLDNETLDDTFDWDGEADTECRIISDYKSTGATVLRVRCNEDSGNNYLTSIVYNDGSNTAGVYDTINGFNLGFCYAGGSCSSDATLYLKNIGEHRKSIGRQNRHDPIAESTMLALMEGGRWTNTADNVESLALTSQGANISGNIRVYKLAKTHLFNQTIYNNTTLNVTTTGSDTTGDGTSQKPFASLGGAISWLKNKTINTDVTVTIQFADGTYNNQVRTTIKNIPGRLVIKGNSSNPAAVTLNFATNQDGIVVHGPGVSPIFIYDMTLNGYDYAQWQDGISAYYNCVVYLTKVIANNFGTGVYAFNSSHAIVRNSCVFNGCYNGLTAQNFGIIDAESCTLSNNVNNGIAAQYKGQVMTENCTFTGNSSNTWTATGGVTAVY